MLFTREPYVVYMSEELEFYESKEFELLGLISLDLTDSDFSAAIMSRDGSNQYRAVEIKVSLETIEEARNWIDDKMGEIETTLHDPAKLFDLFAILVKEEQISNKFKLLNEQPSQLAAKTVLQEIGYHYKDIDGNFVEQFQSKNGFDARFWELFLYCLFREEGFRFNRNSYAPDYMIQKGDVEIAVEAVIISDTQNDNTNIPLPKSEKEINERQKKIDEKMIDIMPLKYGSALFSKLSKKYWELEHVKGKPLVIAIADFHEFMSMSWSQPALIDFLYGYRYNHEIDDSGNLKVIPVKVEKFTKPNGVEIEAGFFNQDEVRHFSAIMVSSTGTIGKFNRMGKQAGLGANETQLFRMGSNHDHNPNATNPKFFHYEVTTEGREKWNEGAAIFHNPNAFHPIDPNLFPSFAHHVFENKFVKSYLPEFYPYNSMNINIASIKEE